MITYRLMNVVENKYATKIKKRFVKIMRIYLLQIVEKIKSC